MSAARAGAGAMAAPSARPAMAPTTTRATVFTDYAPRLTTPELLAQAVARAASSLDRRTHRSLLRLRNGRENRDGEIVSHPRCRAGKSPGTAALRGWSRVGDFRGCPARGRHLRVRATTAELFAGRRGLAQDRAEFVLERGERLEQRGGVGRAHRRRRVGGIVGKVLLVRFFVQHDPLPPALPAREIARPSHRLRKVNGRLSTSARRRRRPRGVPRVPQLGMRPSAFHAVVPAERSVAEREPGPSNHRQCSDYWVPAFAGTTAAQSEWRHTFMNLAVPSAATRAGRSTSQAR